MTRLLAPPPGWTVSADVVVVGSGVAGLTAALHATRAGSVLLVTKVLVDDGSTRWAQGGVAAALAADDSPEDHLQDTLVAGVGLCDVAAVRVLCTEGPARLRELVELGAAFDRDGAGAFALTREGGHSRDRIVHAGGDATGAEVQRALVAAVRAHPGIRLVEHALVLDLLTDADGRAAGVTLHVLGEGSQDGVGAALARAVVLATGGLGQVYASTTNPSVSTGDGVALALRAGAEVTDLEFVQFHPTSLWLGAGSAGQQPLVSEAVRGEGAFLVDLAGERVITPGDHPLADLAPRDVVAKAIHRRMLERGDDQWTSYVDDGKNAGTTDAALSADPPTTGSGRRPGVAVRARGAHEPESPARIRIIGGGPTNDVPDSYQRRLSHLLGVLAAPEGQEWWLAAGVKELQVAYYFERATPRVRTRLHRNVLAAGIERNGPGLNHVPDPATIADRDVENLVSAVRKRTGLGPHPLLPG
ncbi:MAG: L-aspartate oxidase [uncultured Nocardioidaceae bacterium]|uniref:L-aspartate oxidase n=1 Tax=uncultured Nocardioidaceae bacterium TaxID=253824 RepID=A0A6J4MSS3_9ACTN|nr:MAG: L-aspartate oxidase [uncultured Nocardioidaceae bacterium]